MMSDRSAYARVLARPQVRRTFLLSLTRRSAYALVFLPLFYAAQQAASSVAFAGVVIGAYGAGASFLAPARAWSIDRWGARTVLTALIVAFGAAIAGLGAASLGGGPAWTVLVLAAFAGCVAPPLGPTMRVAWASLLPDANDLKKGLSLDSVVEELLYLAGPAAAGLALTVMAPGYALLIPAALVVAGGLAFVDSGPVASRRGSLAHERTGAHTVGGRSRSLMLNPHFVSLVIPALVAGGIAGMVSVTIPLAVEGNGGAGAAGLALGVFAGGSAVGGLLYGALKVPGTPSAQLAVMGGALVMTASLVGLTNSGVWLTVILGCAGLFFSPVMIVAYVAVHSAADARNQNAATTWVNTGHNLGSALVSSAAGVLIQHASVPVSTVVIGAASLALLAVGAVLSRVAVPR